LLEKPFQSRLVTLDRLALLALMISLSGMLLALAYLCVPDHLPDIDRWNEMARLSAETNPHARVHFHDLNPTGMKAFLAIVGLLAGATVSLMLPAPPAASASWYGRLILLSVSIVLLGLLYAGTGVIIAAGGWIGDVWHAARYFLLTISCLSVIPLLADAFPNGLWNEKE
jgi:MFS family permease